MTAMKAYFVAVIFASKEDEHFPVLLCRSLWEAARTNKYYKAQHDGGCVFLRYV